MSRALITEGYLTNIANAIRSKLGVSTRYMPGQMASAISQIHGMPVNQRKTAIKNGTVTPDMGYDGLSQVTVNVPNTYTNADDGKVVIGGSLIDQTSKNITSNGTHNTTTHSSVNVDVPNSYTNADEGKVVSGGQLASQSTRNVNVNGTYDTTRNNQTVVNVPNTYTNADEGKVVSGGQLSSQTPRQAAITANGTYQTQNNSAVTVEVPQTGSTPTLVSKAISANGVYDASDDSADGYTGVTVNVPNTYRAADEGKVVNNGALVSQTVKNITVNGTHSTTTNDEVVVNVPNSYSNADEGKVVDSGVLVEQTSRTVTENGTVDTTTNDEVVVNVPNTYTNADEGKVVDGGELVVQTSKIITENGTVDTTTNNEVVVNVQPTLQSKTVTENGTVTADSGYDGLSQVVVNVQGGVALPHILASNICASNRSHSAGISPSWKKFLLMAINSDASNVTLNPDVDIEGSPVTAETTEYHEYSSTGDNRRNYSINVYDISENAIDALYADFTTIPAHMSWLYAYVSADFEISKVMTSAEAATSGSNSEDGCVLYGTINDNSGGTLTAADYTAGTTITTDNPGSGYKSSFIVWLTKASGDVTVEPLSVTANGTYTAPTGVAYTPVTVNVQPTLQSKTATKDGIVTPDQGYYGLSSVTVDVGVSDIVDFYAIGNFAPNTNANTARSAGIQMTPIYDLLCVGVRFWARQNTCNVYVSDTSGNIIASKQNAEVTSGQWNDVFFDAPVMLSKNTPYVIWGCNPSVTMKYVGTTFIWSQFVTIGSAKYTTSLDTFPSNNETGAAKYGVDAIIRVALIAR